MKFSPPDLLIYSAILLGACGKPDLGNGMNEVRQTANFSPGPSVEEHLLRHQNMGLPVVEEVQVEQIQDLLDAGSLGGRIGMKANAKLSERPKDELTSALLTLVENRETALPIKQLAYARLRDQGIPAMLPRLILRLKYEKDLWSAVCVADTLLRHSNGAGLAALSAVLDREPTSEEQKSARTYAASCLAWLPETASWSPGKGFAEDWQRLLLAMQSWDSQRRLSENETSPEKYTDAMEAELWRIIGRFRSQPLRPVDDARFVLERQRGTIIPLLLQAAKDPDRYVREHALQTLGWIGTPIGHWAQKHGFDYVATLLPSLNDPLTRTRALEALGAAGIPAAAPALLSWIKGGNREEISAACDALLRCADDSIGGALEALLSSKNAQQLSPEAQFSLYTLWFELAPNLEAEYPNELLDRLAETEQQRRKHWLQLRQQNVQPLN